MTKRNKRPPTEAQVLREQEIEEKRDAMLSHSIVLLRRVNQNFPADIKMELSAIGAVMIAPHAHAVTLLTKAKAGIFFCRDHAWMWEHFQNVLVKGGFSFDTDRDIGWWLNRTKICRDFKRVFAYSVVPVIEAALNSGFWWHGQYYVEKVIAAAKKRNRILKAAADLKEALGCVT